MRSLYAEVCERYYGGPERYEMGASDAGSGMPILEGQYTADSFADAFVERYVKSGFKTKGLASSPGQKTLGFASEDSHVFRDWTLEDERKHPRGGGGKWAKKGDPTAEGEKPMPLFQTENARAVADLLKSGDLPGLQDVKDAWGGNDLSQQDASKILHELMPPSLAKPIIERTFTDKKTGKSFPRATIGRFVFNANSGLSAAQNNRKRESIATRVPQDATVIALAKPSGQRLVIHPATRDDRESDWQMTHYANDGQATGHTNPDSLQEAILRGLGISDQGYWNEHGYEIEWTDKDGTKAPFSLRHSEAKREFYQQAFQSYYGPERYAELSAVKAYENVLAKDRSWRKVKPQGPSGPGQQSIQGTTGLEPVVTTAEGAHPQASSGGPEMWRKVTTRTGSVAWEHTTTGDREYQPNNPGGERPKEDVNQEAVGRQPSRRERLLNTPTVTQKPAKKTPTQPEPEKKPKEQPVKAEAETPKAKTKKTKRSPEQQAGRDKINAAAIAYQEQYPKNPHGVGHLMGGEVDELLTQHLEEVLVRAGDFDPEHRRDRIQDTKMELVKKLQDGTFDVTKDLATLSTTIAQRMLARSLRKEKGKVGEETGGPDPRRAGGFSSGGQDDGDIQVPNANLSAAQRKQTYRDKQAHDKLKKQEKHQKSAEVNHPKAEAVLKVAPEGLRTPEDRAIASLVFTIDPKTGFLYAMSKAALEVGVSRTTANKVKQTLKKYIAAHDEAEDRNKAEKARQKAKPKPPVVPKRVPTPKKAPKPGSRSPLSARIRPGEAPKPVVKAPEPPPEPPAPQELGPRRQADLFAMKACLNRYFMQLLPGAILERYAGLFDRSKHPRANAGDPSGSGGRFVSKHGPSPTDTHGIKLPEPMGGATKPLAPAAQPIPKPSGWSDNLGAAALLAGAVFGGGKGAQSLVGGRKTSQQSKPNQKQQPKQAAPKPEKKMPSLQDSIKSHAEKRIKEKQKAAVAKQREGISKQRLDTQASRTNRIARDEKLRAQRQETKEAAWKADKPVREAKLAQKAAETKVRTAKAEVATAKAKAIEASKPEAEKAVELTAKSQVVRASEQLRRAETAEVNANKAYHVAVDSRAKSLVKHLPAETPQIKQILDERVGADKTKRARVRVELDKLWKPEAEKVNLHNSIMDSIMNIGGNRTLRSGKHKGQIVPKTRKDAQNDLRRAIEKEDYDYIPAFDQLVAEVQNGNYPELDLEQSVKGTESEDTADRIFRTLTKEYVDPNTGRKRLGYRFLPEMHEPRFIEEALNKEAEYADEDRIYNTRTPADVKHDADVQGLEFTDDEEERAALEYKDELAAKKAGYRTPAEWAAKQASSGADQAESMPDDYDPWEPKPEDEYEDAVPFTLRSHPSVTKEFYSQVAFAYYGGKV